MIAAGVALHDTTLRQRGLDLLAWLLDYETADGHLSPTPAIGRGAGDPRPALDPQRLAAGSRTIRALRSITIGSRCPRSPMRARAPLRSMPTRSGPPASWPPHVGFRV